MERINETTNAAAARHTAARILLATGLALMPLAAAESADAQSSLDSARSPQGQGSVDWKRQWKDKFDSPVLESRWEVIDNFSEKWDRFSQYRQFGAKVRNGKLILLSRRHCALPGEELTLANAQVASCPPGTLTEYSSGRVQEVKPSIIGNYKIEVEAKLPIDKGVQSAAWANNIADDEEDDGLNAGYCIKGSTTPTAEIDLVESYGDNVAHASHHMYCKDGVLEEIPRVKRFKQGWLDKFHLFAVEKIGNTTTFYVDGEPMRIVGSNPKQYADTPRDYENVSRSEFAQANAYPYGMIFSTFVFDDSNARNESFRAPSADLPFTTKQLKIESIRVFTS